MKRLPLLTAVLFSRNKWWLFRDKFTTDRAVGAVNGTAAEPGPGARTVTDVEANTYISNNRLIGLHQPASVVWGDAKIVWPSLSRVVGRTLTGIIHPVDSSVSDHGFGWATATDIGDPSADGHGWLNDANALKCITPGVTTRVQDVGYIRSMHYMPIVALNDTGAYLLLTTFADDTGEGILDSVGIPKFPTARIVWFTRNGTTDPLFPYFSGAGNPADPYPLGNMLEDIRVVDVPSWSTPDFLAAFADRCTRADSNTSIGNGWTNGIGVWGISSNKIYPVSGAGLVNAFVETGLANGMFSWDFTVPSDWNGSNSTWGGTFRVQDSTNYMRWTNDGGNLFRAQIVLAGAFHATVISTAKVWTAGQTYRITVLALGNKYKAFVDDAHLIEAWGTDADSHLTTATKMGVHTAGTSIGKDYRWDNITATPFTVTLPAILQKGKTPYIWTAGSTLAQDSFTDADATALDAHTAESGGAWTEVHGIWTISSNKLVVADDLSSDWYGLQDVGVSDYECSIDINTPAPRVGGLFAGIILRYTNESNYIIARLACLSPDLPTVYYDIEIFGKVGGVTTIIGRTTVGVNYPADTVRTLTMRVKGDVLELFVDDLPRLSHVIPAGLVTGTKCGPYLYHTACTTIFDDWIVKAIS